MNCKKWIVGSLISVLFLLLATFSVGASTDQTPKSGYESQASQRQKDRSAAFASGLQEVFPEASLRWTSSKDLSLTLIGRNNRIPSISAVSNETAHNLGPAILSLLENTVDLRAYELEVARSEKTGKFGSVWIQQYYQGIQVEGAGVRATVNADGKLAVLQINLSELNNISTSPTILQSDLESYLQGLQLCSTVGQLRDVELVIGTDTKGERRLSYRLCAGRPGEVESWNLLVDAHTGAILRRESNLLHAQFDFSGTITGGYYDYNGTVFTATLQSAGQASFYYKTGPIPLKSPEATEVIPFYADSVGFYEGTLNPKFWVLPTFLSSTEILDLFKGDGHGNYEQLRVEYDTLYVADAGSYTIDHNWTTDPLIVIYPENRWELSAMYHIQAMYEWYRSWLGDDLYFEEDRLRKLRIETRNSSADSMAAYGFYASNSHTIGLGNTTGGTEIPRTAAHEMAHAIADKSLIERGHPVPSWLNEGQADYFAASYFNKAPVPRGTNTLYKRKENKVNFLMNEYEMGCVLSNAYASLGGMTSPALADSMAYFAFVVQDIRYVGELLLSNLILDDDDVDLQNGTPNMASIMAAWAERYVGWDLPLVFLVAETGAFPPRVYGPGDKSDPPTRTAVLDVTTEYEFDILNTYPFNRIDWDFGDETPIISITEFPDYQVSNTWQLLFASTISHQFADQGVFEVICSAYHTWGVNVDTLRVIVDDPTQPILVPDHFATIQDAIDFVDDGREIVVGPGVYDEVNIDFLGKEITVKSSDGPLVTRIVPPYSSGTAVWFRNGEGENSVLEGFKIDGGSQAVVCYNAGPTIKNCIFRNQSTPTVNTGAINLWGDTWGSVGASPARIINCTVVGANRSGIVDRSVSPPTIKNTVVYDNDEYGINWWTQLNKLFEHPELSYNCVFGNGTDYCSAISDSGIGSINVNPLLWPAGSLIEGSPCIDAGDPDPSHNDPDSSRNDIGGWPYQEPFVPPIHDPGLKGPDEVLPANFGLSANYPNPFNPTTTITFALPEAAHVRLTVYNIVGQQIAELTNNIWSAGYHSVTWDASSVAAGVYLYRLEAGTYNQTKKMVLIK